jgi:hypothetical protein
MAEQSKNQINAKILQRLGGLSAQELADLQQRLAAASKAPDGHAIIKELSASPAFAPILADSHDRTHDTHDRVTD